jgi:hypothetical protein
MLSCFRRYFVPIFLSVWCVYPVISQAQSLNRKAGFDQNWKFFKGDSGTKFTTTAYSDAAWQVVTIPHSASYDSTVYSSEENFYQGNCWYRKTFTCPSTFQRVFIEFEGAMQTADIWINGTFVGEHNNSGFTPFSYDISNYLVRGNSNLIALRLNNVKNDTIPPGDVGTAPDFLFFGGLSRDVWLRFKDSVYIPIYSQQIITPDTLTTSARVRAKTPVVNSSGTGVTATLVVTVFNASNTKVTADSSVQYLPANGNYTFNVVDTITNPSLWSPSTPSLYSVQSLVKVNGAVVDSVVEPLGVRWFKWSKTNGFYLNGSRLEIRGMCVHQFEGWVGYATSDERYYQTIKVLKNMGCNSIRCSHYPRPQAFYNACDKLGMLLYVEQPTWGWGNTPTASCWSRMDSCVKEMVTSARNHPSIYAWGMFNEPEEGADFSTNLKQLVATAHSLDSTRPTAEANIGGASGSGSVNGAITIPDIVGLNYMTSITYASNGRNTDTMPWVNTETRNDFYPACQRGSVLDLDTTLVQNSGDDNDYSEWEQMSYTTATSGQLAGGHFWCFKDYNSGANTDGYEGVVDRFTVPKTMYYMFRQNWTGAAPDYPRTGTATTIDLEADTNSLYASGSDYFLITAAMRDGNGRQIAADSAQVTFTISDPTKAAFFGGNLIKAYAGKAAGFLRTTMSAGTFTVTAAYPGLTSQTISLTTIPMPAESYYSGPVSVLGGRKIRSVDSYKLTVLATARGFSFRCPPAAGTFRIVDCEGRSAYVTSVQKGASLFVDHRTLARGLFYAVWEGGNQKVISRINNTY